MSTDGISQTERAASVVAIGGGHGLAATLRALRRMPVEPIAVVSVADDGGSSGRLRSESDRAAPGDLRKCLLALAGDSGPLGRAMGHRFSHGELAGHSFGNLLISALESTEGDLLGAIGAVSELLDIRGTVLPATSDVVELVATLVGGGEVAGQSAVADTAGIDTVRLEPAAVPGATVPKVILDADVVVLGPGSLFTSVLAAAVVEGVPEAIEATSATVVYVCNLFPQAHETDGYSVADHVDALARHGIRADIVLHDRARIGSADGVAGAVAAPLADSTGRAHDPELLAAALSDVITAHGAPRGTWRSG